MLDNFYKNHIRNTRFIVPSRQFYNQDYKPLMEYTGSPIVDRTKTFTDCGYNIVIEDEIPTNIRTVGDFSTIVNDTAISIINLSKTKNKPIAILYSGGMDSTCVTAAFLKHGATITLLYSDASIEENIVFYNEVLKDNQQIIHQHGNPLLFVHDNKDDYIFVTGECGAHLMGTINWSKYGGREIEDESIIGADETAAYIFKNTNPYFNIPDEIKTKLMMIYDKSPVTLKTNYDAQWWAIFALKWQFVKYRAQLWVGHLCEDLINFFMTDDFQMWALTNDVTVKCPNYDWKKYKMPIRQYIYDYFPNEEASILMPKRMSMERTYTNLSLWNRFVLANPKKIAFTTLQEKLSVRNRLTKIH